MTSGETEIPTFPGFPDFRANVTFVPIQFFTVVIPNFSRGTVRIVGYALRKVLGWMDDTGKPTREQLRFTYRELIEKAGVSRDSIAESINEALKGHLLRCLVEPRPDRDGEPGQSGVYELCWDAEGRYTDSPEDFKGFYFPEAAVMEERDGARTVQRPKAARKNIPNPFFDYLLPKERLSVIRVVGALMFYSIQWGPGGERKVPVSKSITELSRLTKMSRHHVHAAVHDAIRSNYLTQTDSGCFDPLAGRESRAATYAINWVSDGAELSLPVRKGEQMQSEKVNGEAFEKGERNQSDNVNGRQSEMVNDISIKNKIKNELTTNTEAAVAGPGFDLLRNQGFDEWTAGRLATRHPAIVIQRQVQYLPGRTATRNRLGLLRRAIEGDWPKPEDCQANDGALAQARQFASHYYAGYHDFKGEAATEPFAKDIAMALKFMPRLMEFGIDESSIPEFGRRFGKLIRQKHAGDAKARPNLSFALVLYADTFLRMQQSEKSGIERKALGQAREMHQRRYLPAYLGHLWTVESDLKESNPTLYQAFDGNRKRLRNLMTSGPILISAERLSRFESDENRLLSLTEFFKDHPQKPVLGFWEWDAKFNPERFGSARPSGDLQEARP